MNIYILAAVAYESIYSANGTPIDEDIKIFEDIKDARAEFYNLNMKYLEKKYPELFDTYSKESAKKYDTDSHEYMVDVLKQFCVKNKARGVLCNNRCISSDIFDRFDRSPNRDETVYNLRIFRGLKDEVVKGYKAFDRDMTCRGFQYEVGMEYEMEKLPIPCNRGFHFCKEAKDCYTYYPELDTLLCEVEACGDITVFDGVKACTNRIRIVRYLDTPKLEALGIKGRPYTPKSIMHRPVRPVINYVNLGDNDEGI